METFNIQYGDLFDNIDVTQSKTVDWDMFANYILIMLYESDDRIKAFSIPNWKPLKQINKYYFQKKRTLSVLNYIYIHIARFSK